MIPNNKRYVCQFKKWKGFGYYIVWQAVNKKSQSTQDIPSEISFETETDFLKFLKKETEVVQFRKDSMTIPEMSRKTKVTERTVKRDIDELIKRGILSCEGGRKEGRWVVNVNIE